MRVTSPNKSLQSRVYCRLLPLQLPLAGTSDEQTQRMACNRQGEGQ